MWKNFKVLLPAVVFCFYILTAQSNIAFAGNATANTELTPDQLIAEHIKSIGGTSVLSSLKTRAFIGSTDVEFIQGMTGSIKNGASSFVSDGEKLQIVMKFGELNYPEEYGKLSLITRDFSFKNSSVKVLDEIRNFLELKESELRKFI